MHIVPGSEGTLGFIFLFVGLMTLGTFTFFDWFFIKLSVQTFQPLIVITEWVILRNINGDVHQFISLCLIPLDPCHLH